MGCFKNDLYDCKRKGCLWSEYQEGVDWGYYSETNEDCAVCKSMCTNDPNCGAVECDEGYCSWWKVGQCTTEEEQKLDFLTCFKNELTGHLGQLPPVDCKWSDWEIGECSHSAAEEHAQTAVRR